MKVVIARKYETNETLGTLVVFNGYDIIFTCKILELPWKDNQHDISCIPEGVYSVVKYDSPKKGRVFLFNDVPDRGAIEMHIGNFAYGGKVDTKGCLLPGTGFDDVNNDGTLDIIESTKTMNRLLGILPSEFKIILI